MGFPFRSEKLIKYLTGVYRLGGLFPDDGYIAGVPKNIFRETNFVGNIGTGLDTLRSFTFPPKSFKIDQQDYIKVLIGGGFANNDDNKRIQVSFGGNVLFNTGSLDLDDFGYFYYLVVFRLGNTIFNWGLNYNLGQFVSDSGTPPVNTTSPGSTLGARNGNIFTLSGGTTFDGNSQTLLLEAESATATDNNIINNIWIGEMVRF